MNDMTNIQGKILEIINSNIEDVKIKSDQADEDLSLIGMDSIRFISIIVALEEAFAVEYPDEYLLITESNTINKITNIISSELAKKIAEGAVE